MRAGLQLRVLQAGHGFIETRWWTMPQVVQPYWVLYRNRQSGTELDLADGSVLRLDPDAAWLLPPWLRYGRRTSRVEHVWVHFEVMGLQTVALAKAISAPVRLDPDTRLDAACIAMRRRMRGPRGDDLMELLDAQSLAMAGFTLALAGLDPRVRAGLMPDVDDDRLRPALERLDSAPAEAWTNARLASLCGLSVPRFVLLFRRRTGNPPHQYLIERRLTFACELLTAGDLSIDAIALACGFADRFAFTHTFTRRIGRTPAIYRSGISSRTGRRSEVV